MAGRSLTISARLRTMRKKRRASRLGERSRLPLLPQRQPHRWAYYLLPAEPCGLERASKRQPKPASPLNKWQELGAK